MKLETLEAKRGLLDEFSPKIVLNGQSEQNSSSG